MLHTNDDSLVAAVALWDWADLAVTPFESAGARLVSVDSDIQVLRRSTDSEYFTNWCEEIVSRENDIHAVLRAVIASMR